MSLLHITPSQSRDPTIHNRPKKPIYSHLNNTPIPPANNLNPHGRSIRLFKVDALRYTSPKYQCTPTTSNSTPPTSWSALLRTGRTLWCQSLIDEIRVLCEWVVNCWKIPIVWVGVLPTRNVPLPDHTENSNRIAAPFRRANYLYFRRFSVGHCCIVAHQAKTWQDDMTMCQSVMTKWQKDGVIPTQKPHKRKWTFKRETWWS